MDCSGFNYWQRLESSSRQYAEGAKSLLLAHYALGLGSSSPDQTLLLPPTRSHGAGTRARFHYVSVTCSFARCRKRGAVK